jgi:tetratricopeptide (TPR) repeat protein
LNDKSQKRAPRAREAPRPEPWSTRLVAGLRMQLARISFRQQLACLFAFGFAVRLAYLLEVKDTEFFRVLVGDGATYDRWAVEIQNDWLGKEPFYQTPLYPYFLSVLYTLFGHDTVVVRVIQMALGSSACALLALAGRRLVSPAVGIVAGVLLSVYAPALFFDGLVQKASIDLFLMCALLYALSGIEENERRPLAPLIAGLVLGALALSRENALVLVPVVIAWLGYRFRNGSHDLRLVRPIAVFARGVALMLTPVAVRNYVVGHEVLLTTSQFGANFYIGNNEHADGKYDSLRWGHGSFPLERRDAFEIAEEATGARLTARQVSAYWSDRAWAWIRSHPLDWLKLMARKWMLVWNANEIADSDEPRVYEDASPVLTVLGRSVVFGTVCPLALVGVAATWRDRKRLAIAYLVLLSMAASASLFVVFARYRFPMVPVILVLAAAGIVDVVRLAREGRTRALLARGAMVAVCAVAVHWNLDNEENPRATAYYNLAVSLEQEGNADRAEANYANAIEDKPDFVQAHVNLGALLARRGDFDGAIVHERKALEIRSEDAIAHTNLANALLEVGHLDEAELHYRAAVRIQPGLAEARDGLAALSEVRNQQAR